MVRKFHRLSARAVATITKPGRHADGGNLYLCVEESGAKHWTFLYERTIAGKRIQKEPGLGPCNAVSLAKARGKAAQYREMLAAGLDPLDARKAARAAQDARKTFGQVADSFLVTKTAGLRNAKHRAQWRTTLATYAAPLWNRPIADIDAAPIFEVLNQIWFSKSEQANRVRGRIEAVFDAARAAGHMPQDRLNPARWKGNLDQLLPPPRKLSRGHHAAMPYCEIPAFLASLRQSESIGALAFEFLILTAGRTSEVLNAQWSEIDFDVKVWTVPASRMKAKREHRVPLSAPALAILEKLAEVKTGAFVFPGQKPGKPLSSTEMVLRRMGVAATPHGFRSSFRDWCGEETPFPREIAEAALAHTIGNTAEQAYRRGDALEKRRALMAAWAQFVEAPP